MKKNLLIALIFCLFSLQLTLSQATFKTMFYNVLNYPLQGISDRLDNLQIIIADYPPDIFMICELNNETASLKFIKN